MNDIVFFALVIYSVGCVIPTALDQQQSQVEYTPVILSGDPIFTQPISHSRSDAWSWQVTATDANKDASLFLRILTCNANGCEADYPDLNMTALPTAPGKEVERTAQTETKALCAQKAAGEYTIKAIVADIMFQGKGNSEDTPGKKNERDWDLTCE